METTTTTTSESSTPFELHNILRHVGFSTKYYKYRDIINHVELGMANYYNIVNPSPPIQQKQPAILATETDNTPTDGNEEEDAEWYPCHDATVENVGDKVYYTSKYIHNTLCITVLEYRDELFMNFTIDAINEVSTRECVQEMKRIRREVLDKIYKRIADDCHHQEHYDPWEDYRPLNRSFC
jgi:hypothetical protein